MSIWCSLPHIGFDDSWDGEDSPNVGQVRSYATGWSNHYPTTDGSVEREACIDLAHMPTWCVPGHHDTDGEIDGEWGAGPWIRMHVTSWEHNCEQVSGQQRAGIVMDETAVRALVQSLTEWLNKPKAHPREADQ